MIRTQGSGWLPVREDFFSQKRRGQYRTKKTSCADLIGQRSFQIGHRQL